jgi:hypothetical protein
MSSGTLGSPCKIPGKNNGETNNPVIPTADRTCIRLMPKNTSEDAVKVMYIANR